MNRAEAAVEKKGQPPRVLKEETLDPFERLATPGKVHSEVDVTVGKTLPFGELKLVARVQLTCDQNEARLNEAGERAFTKALEFMNDGFELLLAEEAAKPG